MGRGNLELLFKVAPKSIWVHRNIQTMRATGKNTLQALVTSQKNRMGSYSRHCGKAGLADWLFWSQKPDIWLFREALGSKIFIWLLGYFVALLQLFHSTNFCWKRVASGTCSLFSSPQNKKQATRQLRNALMNTQVYLKRDREGVQVDLTTCPVQCSLNLFLLYTGFFYFQCLNQTRSP